MLSCTISRLPALQHSPALKKPPNTAASAAASRSASGKTIWPFLPPSSIDTFFNDRAAAAMVILPTRVEPVNDTISTSG